MLDVKPCTQCGYAKPFADFAADSRSKTGRQAACRSCQTALYRVRLSPAKKAEYRRRSGEVVSEYRNREQIALDAQTRRDRAANDRAAAEAERLERARQRLADQQAFEIGSEQWLLRATAEQMKCHLCAMAIKAQPRSGETRLIHLNGRYAVGPHAWAEVDVEDYDALSMWSWKAKPNGSGSGVYAVRNTILDGRDRTIRMHREVLSLGFYEGLDVDHIDRDPLNNSLSNLRLVTRSQNSRNSQRSERAKSAHLWRQANPRSWATPSSSRWYAIPA